VESGKLRRDLFYRLNVFPITLPPLRERLQDLPELVRYFVSRSCARIGKRVHRVPPGVIARLGAYDWPGNVRELENVIERLVILSSGDELEEPAGLLPAARVRPAPESRAGGVPGTLEEIERRHLLEVLEQTRWRIDGSRGAARILNLNPSTLRSRMKKLGIARRNDRS
jgi:DNA-binding NtrC family response regulator